jgi:hypothetical protein
LGNGKLTRKERAELKELTTSLGKGRAYQRRPKILADCETGIGPCPWVSCRYNLFIDVVPVPGRPDRPPIVKLTWPGREIDSVGETCALRVAARRGLTHDAVGALMNLTPQRAEQLESIALANLLAAGGLREFAPDGTDEP